MIWLGKCQATTLPSSVFAAADLPSLEIATCHTGPPRSIAFGSTSRERGIVQAFVPEAITASSIDRHAETIGLSASNFLRISPLDAFQATNVPDSSPAQTIPSFTANE